MQGAKLEAGVALIVVDWIYGKLEIFRFFRPPFYFF